MLSKYQYRRAITRLEHAINSLRPFAVGESIQNIAPNADALAISTLAQAQVDMLKERSAARY